MGAIIMSNKDPGFKVIAEVLPHWLEKKNHTQHNSSRSDQHPTTHAYCKIWPNINLYNRKTLSYCVYICFHFCLSLLNSYVLIFPSSHP